MNKPGRSVKVSDGVDFDCPFCDGKATASAENGMVLHTLPICTTYLRLDAEDYIKAVNDKLTPS